MMTDKQREAFEQEWQQLLARIPEGVMNTADKPFMRDMFRRGAEWHAQQAAGSVPVAWTLQWPSDRKYGTVNYMTTFGSSENAEYYADQAGRDHRGNKDKDVTVVPLYTQPQPPKAVPDSLLEEWATDFEEAIKFAPTRLEKVILKTRAEQCRSFVRKYDPSPLVATRDGKEAES